MTESQQMDALRKHIDELRLANQKLDYKYLNDNMLIGGDFTTLPDAAFGFIPGIPEFFPETRRLLVPFVSSYGGCVLVVYQGQFQDGPPTDGSGWRGYIGVSVSKRIEIGNLPVGGIIESGAFAIDAVQLLVTSHDMTKDECKKLTAFLAGSPKGPIPPSNGIKSRIIVKAALELATVNYPLLVEAGSSAAKPPPGRADPDGDASNAESDPGTTPSAASSATVNKKIGPFAVERFYITYDIAKKTFGIGVDASLELGVLKAVLRGLSATFDVSNVSGQEPFHVKGLEISLGKAGVAKVYGGLLLAKENPLSLYGALTVGIANKFDVALLAAYATVPNERPSLFGFGFIRVPIGGPVFFEVKGLALGIGYERDLIIPPIEKLAKFPFIEAAMAIANPGSPNYDNPFPNDPTNADSLQGVLRRMGDATPPKAGSYWGVIGIAFSSFKVINGFVLISLQVGSATRVSAIGEAQLTLTATPPAARIEAAKPIVFIDIFLRLMVDLAAAEISVDAFINNNSYIVEHDVKITGGAAFRAWYTGEHRGEVVFTVGGYSPRVDFTKYSHYPVVPRVGISLAISDAVTVKGGMYFALTSSAGMYGMAFEVSGQWGPAKAIWAILAFDVMIGWDPFHYDFDISIEVGARFEITVWFVHVSVTAHLGASLHVLGPPFTGEARLDLAICTITWHLGQHASSEPQRIDWDAFKQKYLLAVVAPAADPQESPGQTQSKAVCDIQLAAMPLVILQRTTASDARWLADPETLVISTSSQIPSKTWQATIFGKPQTQQTDTNKAFGIGPCAIADGDVVTTHAVTIEGPNGPDFTITVRPQTVPAAIWRKDRGDPVGPGSIVDNVIGGLELRPVHCVPDRTVAIAADNLLVRTDVLHLPIIAAGAKHSIDFAAGDSVSGSIALSRAVSNRRALFAALGEGIGGITVDVEGFARGDDALLFIDRPRNRLLGEPLPGREMRS